MTRVAEVTGDARYAPYLDHGFVGLINHMGSDQTIEFATRMSYGEGTRQVSDTRALLRYLVRHYHTSPLEMGEVVFHLKLPIAMMRQLVRHRTASLNEYSARYSELTDEFYVPDSEHVGVQSANNKQGSGESFSPVAYLEIAELMDESYDEVDAVYRKLLEQGLARETARLVMPVGGYTEVVWKCDLKNFFHMIKLRRDPHAQKELRDLAETMYLMVKPMFPLVCQAFEDYWLNGLTISVFEHEALKDLLLRYVPNEAVAAALLANAALRGQELSKREVKEFEQRFITEVV